MIYGRMAQGMLTFCCVDKEVCHGRRTVSETLPPRPGGSQALWTAQAGSFHRWRIVLVYFWATLHDRPVAWACEARNWPHERNGFGLPNAATMSRRLRTLCCWTLITGVYDRLRSITPRGLALCRRIDTKPLVVGGFSKDPDAQRGYATGGLARGYKLAVAWGHSVVPDAVTVGPLNASDPSCPST